MYKSVLADYMEDYTLERDKSLSQFESDSYCRGIINGYVQSKVKRTLVTLDVNSMYTSMMNKYPLPTSVREFKSGEIWTLDDILEKSKDTQCCIALVRTFIPLDIGISPVPKKFEVDKST